MFFGSPMSTLSLCTHSGRRFVWQTKYIVIAEIAIHEKISNEDDKEQKSEREIEID